MQLDQFQSTAMDKCRQALGQGKKSVVMYGPCGVGKGVCISYMVEQSIAKGKKSIVFTERRKIRSQISAHIGKRGLLHGTIAAGHKYDKEHLSHVAMVQTVAARTTDDEAYVDKKHLCIIDEAHKFGSKRRKKVLEPYSPKIWFTATPVNIDGADEMIKIATHKQLIESGRLVPIEVIGADEIDMEGVKRVKREYNMEEFGERVRQSAVFGNVFAWWAKANPWHLPTIVFAPLVKESLWLVEQFNERGIPAAHMDGTTHEDEREQMFEDHRNGKLVVISSPQLLTEGVDLPYVHYGILLRPCGPWETFIQTAGRLGRATDGKSKAVLLDHVGATARHGHPQADIDLFLGDTSASIEDRRTAKLKNPKEGEEVPDREPIRCPKCGAMRTPWLLQDHQWDTCWACGHKHVKTTRSIIMVDGTLKKINGERIKPRKQKTHEDFWTGMIFRGVESGMTLNQMKFLFNRERGVWPTSDILPERLLPRGEEHGYRLASDVYPWAKRRPK